MPLKNGDFVLINYVCRIKESGELLDTTLESVAKEATVKRSEMGEGSYAPKFVVIGEGWVPKGLDDALTGMEVGQSATVEVPPEKGFGIRDPSKVRLVPLRRFRAEGITPAPGMQVNIDGKQAQVRAVGAGRVQVDYNHPLAGKTLIYEVSVERMLESMEEKVRYLIQRRLPGIDAAKFDLRFDQDELTIKVPEEAFYIEGIQIAKRSITADIEKFFPEVQKVVFLEIFKKPVQPPQPEEAAQQPIAGEGAA